MRVLLFVDMSSSAHRLAGVVASALPAAGGHARVLSVAPRVVLPPPPPPPWDPEARITSAELAARADADAARITERVAAALAGVRKDIAVDTETRSGKVQDEIVEAAIAWSADLVVMGIDGRTRLERWAASRVARSVVSRAPCSVYVVRREASSETARALDAGVVVADRTSIRA